ncbi:MAG: recombinase RecT [Solirubrobacterales bacterium]
MTAVAEAPSRNGDGPKRDAVRYREVVKASMKKYEVGPGGVARRVEPKGAEVDQFLLECQLRELEPLAGQIYAVWENGSMRAVATIDGMRLLAERTGLYEGQNDPEWCNAEGNWTDYWSAEDVPVAARVRVHRKGAKVPTTGTANWHEFAPHGDAGADSFWNKTSGKPAHMLSIRAEALALRKAFPAQLSGLYTAEELGISLAAIGGADEEPSARPSAVAHDIPPSAGAPEDSPVDPTLPAPTPVVQEAASVPPTPVAPGAQPLAPQNEGPSVIVDEAARQPSGAPALPATKRTLAEVLAGGEYERLRNELTEALFDQMPDRLTDQQSHVLVGALNEAEEAGVTLVELERVCKVAVREGKSNVEARSGAILKWIRERWDKARAEARSATDGDASPLEGARNEVPSSPDEGGADLRRQAPSLLDADPGPEER